MSKFIIEKSCDVYQGGPEAVKAIRETSTENQFTEVSMSLTMYGMRRCSGSCIYCSSRHTMGYDEEGNKQDFVLNKEKIIETFKYFAEKAYNVTDLSKVDLRVDVWGANPLDNFDSFKQTVDFLENDLGSLIHSVKIHTSGNGLEFAKKGIEEYVTEHKIGYQLSHDGLGQFLRTGEIDPLYWDKTKDALVRLAKIGLFDWINCTMSQYNPSPIKNMEYYNKWREENDLLNCCPTLIKLNHIYPGTKPLDIKYVGPDKEYIKNGDVIGDLLPHGESLKIYMKEWEGLTKQFVISGFGKTDPYIDPFKEYLLGLYTNYFEDCVEPILGACGKFQMGINDYSFIIDTAGEFCQCNLLQHDVDVNHKSCKMPDYCNDCEFRFLAECNPCGLEEPEPENPETHKCTFRWYQNRVVKRVRYELTNRILSEEDFDWKEDWAQYKKDHPELV